jgi:3-oxoacyl-[acyl-carrier-protein] synthase II
MRQLVITGTGMVGPAGGGPVPVAEALAGDRPLPVTEAFLARDFDAVALLGRKTTRFNHRTTVLALAACGAALDDAGFEVDDDVRDHVGVTLGTTCGSLTGAVDFGWDTFDTERPYAVNPATFPNLVINTAAGAAAIKYGLRGANSTVAGGPLAGLSALRHAEVTLRACHADTVLVGAAEEFSAPNAWYAKSLRPDSVPGEGAAVFVLERDDVALAAGRTPLACLGAALVTTADVREPRSFRDAVVSALKTAGIDPFRVRGLALRITGDAEVDAAQHAGLAEALPLTPVHSAERIGDCYSAHAAMQLAELLTAAREEHWADDEAGVVLAADPDGALAVAVVTGWSGTRTLLSPTTSANEALR